MHSTFTFSRIAPRSLAIALAACAAILGFLVSAHPSHAATCNFTGAVSTDFNTAGNWSCGNVPTAGDDVVIPAATSTSLSGSVSFSTVSTTGSLNAGAFDMTVTSTATINAGGVVTSTSGIITFGGAVTNNGRIGTVSGGFVFGSSITLFGLSAELDLGSGSSTFIGGLTNLYNSGDAAFINMGSGTFYVESDWSDSAGSSTGGSSTAVFNGSAGQQIYENGAIFVANGGFYNLTIDKPSGSATIGGQTFVDHNLTITAAGGSTLNLGAQQLNVGGDWTDNGTLNGGGGEVRFNGSGAQSISGEANFYDLTINKISGTATLTGETTTTNNFTITNGDFDLGGNTLHVGGNWSDYGTMTASGGTVDFNGSTQTILTPESHFYDLNVNSSVSLTLGGNIVSADKVRVNSGTLALNVYTLSLGGNGTGGSRPFALAGGAFDPGTGVVAYDDNAGLPTDVEATTYADLWLQGADLHLTADTTSTANLRLNSGTTNLGAYTLHVGGDWFNITGSLSSSGAVDLNGLAQTIHGSTTFFNLDKVTGVADTLTFEASASNTVTNTLSLQGASGNLLSLRSSSSGTQWLIDPQGSRSISYVDVQDSDNINASAIILGSGAHSIDSGNNINWTIISMDPAVASINRADSDPTSASTVHFTVTFNEDVTGVDVSDFTLVSTGGVTGAIASVATTTPDSVYTVTVTGLSGNGTLGLNLVDDDSIIDAASDPLGGAGAGNGDFTGQVYTVDTIAPVVTIHTPLNGGRTRMATPLILTTDVNATCSYKLDGGSFGAVADTGNMYHVDNLTGLSAGSHTVILKCLDAALNAGYATSTWTKLSPGSTVLFGVDGANSNPTPNLYTINPETGSKVSTIGPVGFDVTGLAQDPITGLLYGSTGNNDPAGSHPQSLVRIDPTTGAGTFLGTLTRSGGSTHNLADIAFNAAGQLYGWSENGDDLYTVDISSCDGATCVVTRIADSGISSYGDGMDFNSAGTLYAMLHGDGNYFTIDPGTGLSTSNPAFVNPSGSGYAIGSGTFDDTDMYFGARRNFGSSPSDLIVVDVTSSIIATMGGNNPDMVLMDAIEFYTPPPGTPVISPGTGSYSSSQTITIISTSSTSIRYTTNGTTPTCTVGTLYTGSFVISSSATIKAIGCVTKNRSSVSSATYTITISSGGGGGGGGIASPTPTYQIYYNGQYYTQEQYSQLFAQTTTTTQSLIITPPLTGEVDPSNLQTLMDAGYICNTAAEKMVLLQVKADATEFGLTLTAAQAMAIRNFIICGNSLATVKFGMGERRAIIRDYMDTVRRPGTIWSDVERIATGLIPINRNLTIERQRVIVVLPVFRRIYGHDPNFKSAEENLVWNTLMYRIRFPRDLVKETLGLKRYYTIYRHNPTTPFGWAVVRALGYVKI